MLSVLRLRLSLTVVRRTAFVLPFGEHWATGKHGVVIHCTSRRLQVSFSMHLPTVHVSRQTPRPLYSTHSWKRAHRTVLQGSGETQRWKNIKMNRGLWTYISYFSKKITRSNAPEYNVPVASANTTADHTHQLGRKERKNYTSQCRKATMDPHGFATRTKSANAHEAYWTVGTEVLPESRWFHCYKCSRALQPECIPGYRTKWLDCQQLLTGMYLVHWTKPLVIHSLFRRKTKRVHSLWINNVFPLIFTT